VGGLNRTTLGANINFTNDGSVSVAGGWLDVDHFTQNAGQTEVAAGATLGSTGAVLLEGGALSSSGAGSGFVNASVNNDAGVVSPGGDGSVGLLTVVGNYTQGARGSLDIDLAGTTAAGVDYDQLAVIGAGHTATLDGTLNVTILPDYMPAVGDSFTVLTAPSVRPGTFFANVHVAGLDPSLQLTVAYDPSDVTLTVAPNAMPSPAFAGRRSADAGPASAFAPSPGDSNGALREQPSIGPSGGVSASRIDDYFRLSDGSPGAALRKPFRFPTALAREYDLQALAAVLAP
jgi:hypothetical protein